MPTVLLCESFDHFATADLPAKGYGAGVSLTVASGAGRNGTSGMRSSAANFAGALTAAITNQASVYVDVAFRPAALPGADAEFILLMDAGSVQTDLRLTATGELRITRNGTSLAVTSGLGMIAGTYYHIGFMSTIHDTAGVYEVKVNGVSKLSGSGADTKSTGNAFANQVRLQAVTSIGTDFDDFIVSSDAFCGDCRVKAILPDSAGNYSQWTPSAGSGFQCVDEALMNSDTDYVSSSTAGQRNSYGFAAVGLTGTVKAVQHVTAHRKDDAGSRSIRQFARISGTDYDGSVLSVADTYVMSRRVMVTNPATGADWTVSAIDAAEFGSKLES